VSSGFLDALRALWDGVAGWLLVNELALFFARMAAFIVATYVVYEVSSRAIRVAVLGRHSRDEDVDMLQRFWRALVIFVAPMVFVAVFFPRY